MSPIPLQVARGTLTLFADLAHRVLDLATWSARALWACAFPVLSLLLGVGVHPLGEDEHGVARAWRIRLSGASHMTVPFVR